MDFTKFAYARHTSTVSTRIIRKDAMGRHSSLISHPQISEIHAALAAATPVAMVAKDFGISQSAVFRYKASRFGKASLQNSADQNRTLDYVAAAADALRDADSVRRAALANNDSNLVLKASLVINQLTRTLSLRLGVDGSNTATLLSEGDAVVLALAQVIRETPGVAAEMVKNLHVQGHHDLANEFLDFSETLTQSPKMKAI